MRLSPEAAAAKWARRASQATGDYTDGIRRVQTAPGQLAAQKKEKALNGYQAAMASGHWERRVASVSLADWQRAAAEKGAARLASGVQAAEGKMADAMRRVGPMIDSARAKIASMPDATVEDRINRSAAFQREMARQRGRIK